MTDAPAAAPALPSDPTELLKSRSYVILLVLGAIVGVPIAAGAYFFLKLVSLSQGWLYQSIPSSLGYHKAPIWWPLPILAIAGLLVALVIQSFPGHGGEEPSEGFKPPSGPNPANLPGLFLAALVTLVSGAVLGPEAPLIAMGGASGALIIHLIKKDAPAQAVVVIGAAGSFAAIATLLGSPIVAAFLLMEAVGLGGPLLGIVLMPGLLAAGIGSLIFIGLDGLTGFGTFSLSVAGIPSFPQVNGYEFLWAIGIGLLAAVVGSGIRRGSLVVARIVSKRRLLLTPVIGVLVALCAIIFQETTTHSGSNVLFSGQYSLGPLLDQAKGWTAGALVLLVACKGVGYLLSLSSFRGGPIFPSMLVGAAGGMALSHLGGLPMIAGAAMGIGGMMAVMLRLPMTSVLITALFLSADATHLVPLIIVSVVVAFVASARLMPVGDDALVSPVAT